MTIMNLSFVPSHCIDLVNGCLVILVICLALVIRSIHFYFVPHILLWIDFTYFDMVICVLCNQNRSNDEHGNVNMRNRFLSDFTSHIRTLMRTLHTKLKRWIQLYLQFKNKKEFQMDSYVYTYRKKRITKFWVQAVTHLAIDNFIRNLLHFIMCVCMIWYILYIVFMMCTTANTHFLQMTHKKCNSLAILVVDKKVPHLRAFHRAAHLCEILHRWRDKLDSVACVKLKPADGRMIFSRICIHYIKEHCQHFLSLRRRRNAD